MKEFSQTLGELFEYKDKKILCIKDTLYEFIYVMFKKGEFYELHNISWLNNAGTITNIKINMYSNHVTDFEFFNYDDFIEHFELRTLQDIRKDKIKSILE